MKSKHLQNAKLIDSINFNAQNTQNSFGSQVLSILSINHEKQIKKAEERGRQKQTKNEIWKRRNPQDEFVERNKVNNRGWLGVRQLTRKRENTLKAEGRLRREMVSRGGDQKPAGDGQLNSE